MQISLTMPWRKARKLIKEDPRYKNYGDSDQVGAPFINLFVVSLILGYNHRVSRLSMDD